MDPDPGVASGVTPRSAYYDGRAYARLIEPLTRGLHALVAKRVPEGSRVLDACCGTGALAFRLAPGCREVVGVDLSPRQVAWAESERVRRGVDNVRFSVADASALADHPDASFDLATVLLALHEMPTAVRAPVLREIGRVARRVLVLDFHAPMPWNVAGVRNRFVEMVAGPTHFAGFRDWLRRGGLPPLAQEAGLGVVDERRVDARTVVLATLERR